MTYAPYIQWRELPENLKQLKPEDIALWLWAHANAIEGSFDMGFPLKALEDAEKRANVLREAAKELTPGET